MIDFDSIADWHPSLATMLGHHLPGSIAADLMSAQPEFIEDAADVLFEHGDRDAIVDATIDWLREGAIAGYHGSRLTESDIASIRSSGLIPLEAGSRRERLARALSRHHTWHDVSEKLDDAIVDHGSGNRAGHREGQAHLTLSKSGLTERFNHYIQFGAEFDQHVAHSLIGADANDILAMDGIPTLVSFAVPGISALDAAHPIFTIDDRRRNGDLPNIVGDFLEAWSYRLAYPTFQSRTLNVDCGMVFHSVIPAEWIVSIEAIQC